MRATYRHGRFAGTEVGGVVYRITCHQTGKVYIGQTKKVNPFERWRAHIHAARSGVDGRLYDAMREFGEGAFQFEVIASVPRVRDVHKVEAELISQYQSEENGYNGTGPKKWAEQRAELVPLHSALRDAIGRVGTERVIQLLIAAA